MRIRLPLGRTLFFLGMLLAALVALVPMRLGFAWLQLDHRGISARETRGSVWNGSLVEAQLAHADIGDVGARLSFYPLLIGRARINVDRESEAVGEQAVGEFDGAISIAGSDFGIDDMTARLPASELFAPLPVAAIDLDELSVKFRSDLCVAAEGMVRAELSSGLGDIALPSSVAGAARCDEGALLLPMIGQSGMDQLNLRIAADGSYTLEYITRPGDDAMREKLLIAGFQPSANGYRITAQGKF